MNNIIKIFSLSLLIAGANILSAADDKDSTRHSASMVSTVTFCEIGDIQTLANDLKKEEAERICRYIDSLAQGAPQFLADSIPVGGPGQPTDLSCAAFKETITRAIMAVEVSPPAADGTKVDVKRLRESVKWGSVMPVVERVLFEMNLRRWDDEMLHSSVSGDRSLQAFMGCLQ